MKIKYITIEREYGSGGSEIAKRVAEKCGINCYGREILEIAAENQNVSVEAIEEYEESASNSFLYSLYVMAQAQSGNTDILPMESKLFIEEHNTIKALADNGPAVFVGHCASYALRNHDGVLKVFIRADNEFKKQRAIKEYSIGEKEAEAVCRKFNKKRANYYSFNTSKKWDDFSNYHLVMDSSVLGVDGCIEMLASLMNKNLD